MSISVLILTLNEEVNLKRALGSVNWCDDVVVLDSLSDDGTEEIACTLGARFIEREFDNYAGQRNFGLKEIPYKHKWVLMLDADEVVTPELKDEMLGAVRGDNPAVLLFMRRKDHFIGRWIKRSSGYPTWFGRLMRPSEVWVERSINEEYRTEGAVGYLKSHLTHYPFNKGFSSWFEKHNRYSTMEAELIVQGGATNSTWSDLFNADPMRRRSSLKRLFYKLPLRPVIMFAGLYFVRGGFLDGRAGLTYCLLRATYEFMINCKIKEIKRREQGQPL